MTKLIFLPNKEGNYKQVKLPNYIADILKNVKNAGCYTFRLSGVNPVRPAYGIEADLKKLEKWAKRHYADFQILKINSVPKNYYGLFFMTDPVCHQLEKIGYLK